MNKVGFGFLRLPLSEDGVSYPLLNQMVDLYLERGGRYFDTAYTYLNGKSEEAIREAVVKRHPRGSFVLADKLPGYLASSKDDCHCFFEEQLRRCGVTYFDVYMLHWLNTENYQLAERYDEFAFLRELKTAGRVRKIGFSYHDTAGLLDEILTLHPEVDIVQLQINYADWESEAIQSRRCYEAAQRHGKPVIVMEPVKGGALAALPEEAAALLNALNPAASAASYAIRFAQSLPGVEVVLSGMNSLEQMRDNLRELPSILPEEAACLKQVAEILKRGTAIACTGCAYCIAHCPQGIPIPQIFRLYNEYHYDPSNGWKIMPVYKSLVQSKGKASDCVQCRSCESHCPQTLPIANTLKKVVAALE